MSDGHRLEQEIRKRLQGASDRRQNVQKHVQSEMEDFLRCKESFEIFARKVTESLIRPQMEKLAGFFNNSMLSDLNAVGGYGYVCRLCHSNEYPANTTLTLSVSSDGTNGNAIVTYDLEIIPIFFRFKGHDQLAVSATKASESVIEEWVENKLIEFTDTYLQLQVIEQYQESNMVVDPVCGMRINLADAAAHLEYGGRKYYFCVGQCRQKFLSAPDRYATKQRQ